MMTLAIRILGLDPGLGRMGWGVIEVSGTRLAHVGHGVIVTTTALGLGFRLLALHRELSQVIEELRPLTISVEQAFVHKDPSAALKLGHARAVALLAAAQAGLEIAEYTPNHIKKSVVGVGHADKAQVLAMVRRLLPTAGVRESDAADALAAAIAHAHLAGTQRRIAQALAGEVATGSPSASAQSAKALAGEVATGSPSASAHSKTTRVSGSLPLRRAIAQ